jgi:hypothetical protein
MTFLGVHKRSASLPCPHLPFGGALQTRGEEQLVAQRVGLQNPSPHSIGRECYRGLHCSIHSKHPLDPAVTSRGPLQQATRSTWPFVQDRLGVLCTLRDLPSSVLHSKHLPLGRPRAA